ncbi:hypothetical protein [Flavisolibacter ginsenosidimutans]|uniref:hypothetical protein n=1 Tax=Flavisolibacter ginsenosidimutans TaxID=661481 RepID=UPI00155ABBC3|nr:hypothetical protein [Flavisolibacter ginsenosidimutans]
MEKIEEKKDFAAKVMEGLQLAVQKLIEDARKNGHPLVVSKNGKPELIQPK